MSRELRHFDSCQQVAAAEASIGSLQTVARTRSSTEQLLRHQQPADDDMSHDPALPSQWGAVQPSLPSRKCMTQVQKRGSLCIASRTGSPF